MSKIKTFVNLLKNDRESIGTALINNVSRWTISHIIPDKIFLKLKYRLCFGKRLNLKNPQTFNEKLQWLKLYDRNPIYTTMVDKCEVKKHVASIIGDEYIIPTLGVWDNVNDIDFESLPNQFVLKCTHDSGSVFICRDKSTFDIASVKKRINNSLKRNLFWWGREWPYKYVKPRIIAEQYMVDESSNELNDYKFMCYDGDVKNVFTCTERYTKDGLKVTFFDTDWKQLPFSRHYPVSDKEIPKPKTFDEMVELAEKLSKGIPFVRVDFYEVCGKPYFGEMTFFPGNGMEEFTPEIWDNKLGELIKLPENSGGGTY